MATAHAVRDQMVTNWMTSFYQLMSFAKEKIKVVSYLSSEFLLGPHLGNTLVNLGLTETVRAALASLGQNLEDILPQEVEPGLGNGGLGRLAACYLESLATVQAPAFGYGIRYEFGIFDQVIRNGWQVERPTTGSSTATWEVRPDLTYEVKFGGKTEHVGSRGRLPSGGYLKRSSKALPDTPLGYRSRGVSCFVSGNRRR
jgi:starch phosphorylase